MNLITLLTRRSGLRRRRGRALVMALLALIVRLPLALPAAAAGPAAPAAQPPVLRLYLHGDDIPGTADGFTMNTTPASAHLLTLTLITAPRWYSDPPFTG